MSKGIAEDSEILRYVYLKVKFTLLPIFFYTVTEILELYLHGFCAC